MGSEMCIRDRFHGMLTTFLAAGFEEKAELKPGRTLVALELSG